MGWLVSLMMLNYGPNELIVDGENGFVVPYEGIQEMADRLVELFTQEDKLQKMSTQSYELARRYSEENSLESLAGPY